MIWKTIFAGTIAVAALLGAIYAPKALDVLDPGGEPRGRLVGAGNAVQVDANGHLIANQKVAPTVATCGSGAVAGGSTDIAGAVTATGATACTVTWAQAYVTAPFCVLTDYTTAAGLKGVPTTTNIAVTGLTSGDKFGWQCTGQTGG